MKHIYSKIALKICIAVVLLQVLYLGYTFYEFTINPPKTLILPPIFLLTVPLYIVSGIFGGIFDPDMLLDAHPVIAYSVPVIINGVFIYLFIFCLVKVVRSITKYLHYLVS